MIDVIKETLFTTNNNVNSACIIKERLKTKYPLIHAYIYDNTQFLNENCSISQRLYHIIHNIKSRPLCPKCNKVELRFITYKRGYSSYCRQCGLTISGDMKKASRKKNKTKELIRKTILHEIKDYYEKSYIIHYINEKLKTNDRIYFQFCNNHKLLIKSILFHTQNMIKTPNSVDTMKDLSINERCYLIYNKLNKIPTCNYCNNKAYFYNFSLGYNAICNNKSCQYKWTGYNKMLNSKEKVETNIKALNCELIEEYKGNKRPIQVKCLKCNKKFIYNFPNGSYFRDNLCPYCSPKSKPELEILDFLKDFNPIHNSRSLIPPLELDIYLPEHKLAIEFDGLYYHSEQNNKDKKYHLNKTELCEQQEIQLIHIFEDEWRDKQEIVKSVLLSKLGKLPNRIYARKCEIKELTSKESKKFLEENHLQGNCNASIKLGLFYEDELVSCMTFGKRSITGKPAFELLRFCNKKYVSVVGGASKLFKYFINNYEHDEIISYADRRYSIGGFYEQLGFEFIHNSAPSYWYMKIGSCILEHRSKFMKHKLINILENYNPDKTEYENMLENGFDRIWDCGCKVYKYRKEI